MSEEKDGPTAGVVIEMFIPGEEPTMQQVISVMCNALNQMYPTHGVDIVLHCGPHADGKLGFHMASNSAGPVQTADVMTKFAMFLMERELAILEQNPGLNVTPTSSTKH